jgi:hypothetical protein
MNRAASWALLSAGVLLALTATARPAEPSCGSPGKPPCPLQAFMRTHAAAPLSAGDYVALEQSLATIARQNPEPAKWANWTKIAADGAAAAREGRAAQVRASCGRCHRAYRRAYNGRYRELSVAR